MSYLFLSCTEPFFTSIMASFNVSILFETPPKSFLLFFVLMLIVLARTRFFYFNPIFLVLGYKFYFIKQTDDSKILVISKKEIKTVEELFDDGNGSLVDYISTTKVNDYTFLILE